MRKEPSDRSLRWSPVRKLKSTEVVGKLPFHAAKPRDSQKKMAGSLSTVLLVRASTDGIESTEDPARGMHSRMNVHFSK